MTVADRTARPAPPAPEECSHPSPLIGVMAHEFSPYSGAMGPEGTRRTTMHYGPVIGGLPISAWHCETCGLLRLDYVDGRKEERRLYPGPQPGLIAFPVSSDATEQAVTGAQAQVGGLTAPSGLFPVLGPAPAEAPAFRLPTIHLPAIGWADSVTCVLLVATAVGLCLLGIGAVDDWKTASWEGGAAVVTGCLFGAAVALQVTAAGFRHLFPAGALSPSPAEVHRGRPELDAATRAVVAFLTVVTAGLAIAGILAVYDWRTPGAEGPVADVIGAFFGLAVIVAIVGAAVRHMPHRTD